MPAEILCLLKKNTPKIRNPAQAKSKLNGGPDILFSVIKLKNNLIIQTDVENNLLG
jgi:hypothetical protein